MFLNTVAVGNLKAMAGGHAMYERQAILSTMVVLFFCIEKEPIPEGCGTKRFRNESVGLGPGSSDRNSGALVLRPFSPRRQGFF